MEVIITETAEQELLLLINNLREEKKIIRIVAKDTYE